MRQGMANLTVMRNVLREEHLTDLRSVAASQRERKELYDLGAHSHTPEPIRAAGYILVKFFGIQPNTAQLKRYRNDDPILSKAYLPHPDPGVFGDELIGIYSLDGEAELTVRLPSGIETPVDCYSNTLVVLDPDLPHWVTPPQNEDGIRHILFFGRDSTKSIE